MIDLQTFTRQPIANVAQPVKHCHDQKTRLNYKGTRLMNSDQWRVPVSWCWWRLESQIRVCQTVTQWWLGFFFQTKSHSCLTPSSPCITYIMRLVLEPTSSLSIGIFDRHSGPNGVPEGLRNWRGNNRQILISIFAKMHANSFHRVLWVQS